MSLGKIYEAHMNAGTAQPGAMDELGLLTDLAVQDGLRVTVTAEGNVSVSGSDADRVPAAYEYEALLNHQESDGSEVDAVDELTMSALNSGYGIKVSADGAYHVRKTEEPKAQALTPEIPKGYRQELIQKIFDARSQEETYCITPESIDSFTAHMEIHSGTALLEINSDSLNVYLKQAFAYLLPQLPETYLVYTETKSTTKFATGDAPIGIKLAALHAVREKVLGATYDKHTPDNPYPEDTIALSYTHRGDIFYFLTEIMQPDNKPLGEVFSLARRTRQYWLYVDESDYIADDGEMEMSDDDIDVATAPEPKRPIESETPKETPTTSQSLNKAQSRKPTKPALSKQDQEDIVWVTKGIGGVIAIAGAIGSIGFFHASSEAYKGCMLAEQESARVGYVHWEDIEQCQSDSSLKSKAEKLESNGNLGIIGTIGGTTILLSGFAAEAYFRRFRPKSS